MQHPLQKAMNSYDENEPHGDDQKLLELCNQVLEWDPDEVSWMQKKAKHLRNLGRIEESITLYEEAVVQDYRECFDEIISILEELGRSDDQIINVLDRILAKKPNCYEAWNKKAMILFGQGKIEESIHTYEEGWMQNSDGVGPKLLFALKFLKRKDRALEILDLMLIIRSIDSKVYKKEKAQVLFASGSIEEAKELFEDLITDEPDYGLLYYALTLDGAEMYDKAIEVYDRLIELGDTHSFHGEYFKAGILYEKGQFENLIPTMDKAYEKEPTNSIPLLIKGKALIGLGKKNEGFACLNKLLETEKKKKTVSALCYKGQALHLLGRTDEAMEVFKEAKKVYKTTNPLVHAVLYPMDRRFSDGLLKSVFEFEAAEEKAITVVKGLQQNSPAVKNFLSAFQQLQEKKKLIQRNILGNISNNPFLDRKKHNEELANIQKELDRKINELQSHVAEMETNVKVLDEKVAKLEVNLEEMKQEVNNKLDNFNKKLKTSLQKQGLTPADQIKLQAYFHAFVETFSSMYVTSQVINSGQVTLDLGNSTASLLSTVASCLPFIGNTISTGINSINDFLQSKELKTNARKMRILASDAANLSQLIGKVGYDILTDQNKQQEILRTTEQDLKQVSANLYQQISSFCSQVNEDLDIILYTSMFKTIAERVGNNDANSLIQKWLQDSFAPYDIEQQFVQEILAQINVADQEPTIEQTPLTPVSNEIRLEAEGNGDFCSKSCSCNIF